MMLAESVAISGEALLIGLVVLLALGVLAVATITGLVYLGARIGVWLVHHDEPHRDPAAIHGPRVHPEAPSDADAVPALPYHLIGDPGARRRPRRCPLTWWVWTGATIGSVAIVACLPHLWFLGVLIAPALGALGAELTRFVDRAGST